MNTLCVCVSVRMQVRMPEVKVECLPLSKYKVERPYFLRQGLSLYLKFTDLVRLAVLHASGILLFLTCLHILLVGTQNGSTAVRSVWKSM